MASSPLSSVLSPAQIAVVQQARALVAKPQVEPAVQTQAPSQSQPARAAQPTALRGRGQIINISV